MGETLTRRLLAQALFGASVAIALWSLVLVLLNRETWLGDPGEAFGLPLSALAFAVVGLIIVRSRSENPVGWVMILQAGAMALMTWGSEYALRDYTGRELAFAKGAAYVSNSAVTIVLGSLVALALLFPTGRLKSRLGSVMMWLVVLGTAASFGLSFFEVPTTVRFVEVGADGLPAEARLASPLLSGLSPTDADNLQFASSLLMLWLPLGAAVVRVIRDFTRGDVVERRQLKWIAYVLVVGFGLMGVSQLGGQVISGLNQIGGLIILIGVPVAMGIAIARHGLYEIDRIVSRTVSYAALVVFLGAIFTVGVVLVPNLVPGLEGNEALVAVSTLATAAMFNPLRIRLQRVVDRRFNRTKYDAELVVEDFTGTLRGRVDPDSIVDGWTGVVSETMQPSRIAVWVRSSA